MFTSIKSKMLCMVAALMIVTMLAVIFTTKKIFEMELKELHKKLAQDALQSAILVVENEYDGLVSHELDSIIRRRELMESMISGVVSRIHANYQLYRSGIVSEDEAKKISLNWIRNFRYGADQYFFVFDMDLMGLSHPLPNMIGEKWTGFKDLKLKDALLLISKSVREQFTDYTVFQWPTLDEQTLVKHMGYFSYYPEWEWIVGTTVRIDDLEKDSRKKLEFMTEKLENIFLTMKFAETGHIFLFNGSGGMLVHPKTPEENISDDLLKQRLIAAAEDPEKSIEYSFAFEEERQQIYLTYVKHFKALDWYVAASIDNEAILVPARRLAIRQAYIILAVLLCGIFVAHVLSKRIIHPLEVLSQYARSLPEKDLTAEDEQPVLTFTTTNNEIRQLARSFIFMETQLRNHIKELNTYHEHLEELVEARTNELTQTNRRLQEEITEHKRTEEGLQHAKKEAELANQAKSEFLANMSHELRTPLNAILGYAQILKTAENLTNRQREALETIQSSGEHLLTLINDILDLSKIEARRMELQAREFLFPELLKHIANIMQIHAEQQGLVFIAEIASNLPVGVRADEKRLREVLLNLLGNAIKFTGKGNVTFRVMVCSESRSLRSDVGANEERHSEDYVAHYEQERHSEYYVPHYERIRFEVEDTGIGIAPEKLGEIFLPFQQIGELHKSIEGTGLGLAISRRLVEMMGGELLVKSVVGQGSVFWFELDLPEVPGFVPRKASYGRRIVGYQGERCTVLVVDDDTNNRAVLVRMLLPLGFRVAEATNGQECIEKMLKCHPDLILLDLRMPVMDGYEAAKQIREYETRHPEHFADVQDKPRRRTRHQTVIIAVSASVFESNQQKALTIGCNDFLIKPFHLENLLELLHIHLGLEWIYEEKAEELPKVLPQVHRDSSSGFSLPPEDLEILLTLASKSRIKSLLQHLAKIETANEKYRPFVEEMRYLAKGFQSKEIVKRLQQIKGKT